MKHHHSESTCYCLAEKKLCSMTRLVICVVLSLLYSYIGFSKRSPFWILSVQRYCTGQREWMQWMLLEQL